MKSLENLLLEFLTELRKKPEIYLGEKSLRNLQHFIDGSVFIYSRMVGRHNEFLPGFQPFIQKKYNGGDANSVYGIIIDHVSPDKGLDTYFELLDEFLALSQEEQDKYIPKYIKEQMKASDQIE